MVVVMGLPGMFRSSLLLICGLCRWVPKIMYHSCCERVSLGTCFYHKWKDYVLLLHVVTSVKHPQLKQSSTTRIMSILLKLGSRFSFPVFLQ